MEPFFPATASIWTVLAVFVVFLVAFDLVLVRWLQLGKIAWKRVEYVWLGFAMIGVLAAIGQIRIAAANAQVALYETRARTAFSPLISLVKQLSSEPGAVCRVFVRSEWSPPPEQFDAAQRDYDRACEWFKAIARAMPSEMPTPPKPIAPTSLPARPDVSAIGLADIIGGFFTQLRYFNERVKIFADLAETTRRTSLEEGLFYSSPFLLVLALALRITKVTGEIKIERYPTKPKRQERT